MAPAMKRIYSVLEYDKILSMLSERTSSALAAAEALSLKPAAHQHVVSERLAETAEAVSVIMRKGTLSLGEFGDIRRALVYAEKGGSLTMAQILDVARQMGVARRAALFLGADIPPSPLLNSIRGALMTDRYLEERITAAILSDTEMASGASPALRGIRRSIALKNDAIRAQLDRLIASHAYREILQEQLVTIRDGRYVVPVKQEHRHRLPGIVHDQSKGGATLFIEPQAVVELNNKLRELELEEAREIDRILAAFSADVGAVSDALRLNQELLTRLDFIFAKGCLACDMKAVLPEIDGKGQLEIVSGRHPLIDPAVVVPVSLDLGIDYHTLIITGPNTGGKTVTLKTVGLFLLMAAAGLHLPASRAKIPLMPGVFADIGDEQSIEQSLSTFSAHMKNIVGIVRKARAGDYIFLDELGAGTDPAEGAALAIAILETLRDRGCMVLATTHYTELKKYAVAAEGVENASMEFDVETLSPTFRLIVGMPGRSNAFEISRKLGLPEALVSRAADHLDTGSIAFETVIEQAELDRRAAAAAREEAERLRAAQVSALKAQEENRRIFEEKQDEMLAKAHEEALQKVSEAEDYAAMIRDDLKAILDDAETLRQNALAGYSADDGSNSWNGKHGDGDDHDHGGRHGMHGDNRGGDGRSGKAGVVGKGREKPTRGGLYKKLDDNRKFLRELKSGYGAQSAKSGGGRQGKISEQAVLPGMLQVGDRVRLRGMDMDAEVLNPPDDKGEVQVLAGRIRMSVSLSDLVPVDGARMAGEIKRKPAREGSSRYSGIVREKIVNISGSIDLHGKNLDEAELIVDKYLDDAFLAGLPEVIIVHGRGAGILRSGLRRMLTGHRHVKKTRSGGPDEGGDGATVVTIK